MAVPHRHHPVSLVEQRLGKVHHLWRLRVAEGDGVQVAQTDSSSPSILQQRRQAPMGIICVQFLRKTVVDHGGVDQRIIALQNAAPGEECPDTRQRFTLLHGRR